MRNLVTRNGCPNGLLQLCLTFAFALLLAPAMALGQTFVQLVDTAPGNGPAAAFTTPAFTTPETAGDLNVVAVGWSDQTSSVISVTDSNSNTYVLAGTSGGGGNSVAIYYAKNILVSTTTTPTVTVTFNNSTLGAADVRALEYTGFSSAAVTVDNWIGNSGSTGGSPASSNTMATSTSSLLVGAGTASATFAATGLPGYMMSRGVNAFGDITMDSNGASAAGTYQASANVSADGWVLQAVGLSIAGIPTLQPTVASIAPASGSTSGGEPVTITGTNFSNGAVALFGTAPTGISLVNCVVTNSTTMTCDTPGEPSTATVDLTVVNVDGKLVSLAAAFSYSITSPTITGISPATSTTDGGTAVTITGTNFEGGARVTIGGLLPPSGSGLFADHVAISPTTITINTPALSVGAADVDVKNPDGGFASSAGALTYALGTGAINYIQRGDAATGRSAQNIPVPMANPQGKGDLNVVIVGWSDVVSLVSSVTDTEGNTYVAALPTTNGAGLSQVVYYAKNILGDGVTPNTITVNMTQAASSPDVRVLEYSGLNPNTPLDQGVGAAGAGATADTGACLTTSPVELIVAAATVSSNVTAAGPNFTTVDYTDNGDNAEHQITSAVGSCEATALVNGGSWVIQTVSFKAGAAGAGVGYTLTADAPTSDTVTAGGNASYALTLAAQGGFSSPVTLSCSGLPTGATCGFSPANPVTPGSSTLDTLTISTTGSTPAGTSTVTITGTPAPSQTATVMLTVTASTAPGFTVAATALSPATVSPGASATSTITITPVNGFTGSVAFSCSSITGGGTPAPTCSFSTVTNGSSTLTVSTTANSTANSPRSTGLFYALLLPIGGMTLLGAGFSSRRKMLVGILLVCMLIAGFIFMTACSSSGSSTTTPPPGGGTPAGTYNITVSGTATGATTQTQALTLVVN